MCPAENIHFNPSQHDERGGTALEAPAHRDRDGHFSLREANSSRAVSLPMILHPPPTAHISSVLWQVSSWCGRREQHAGADSSVKMITNAPEARHPVADGAPPPSRRLHHGGAGRRRRPRLHLRAALPTLWRVHGRLEWRAPRPPAASCVGTCLVGQLRGVLGWSMHILLEFVCLSCDSCVMLRVRRVEVLLWWL